MGSHALPSSKIIFARSMVLLKASTHRDAVELQLSNEDQRRVAQT